MALKAGRYGVNRNNVDSKGNVIVDFPEPEVPEVTPGNVGGITFTASDKGKVLAVNAAGTDYEWVEPPQGGGGEFPVYGRVITGKIVSGGKIAASDSGYIIVAELPEAQYANPACMAVRLILTETAGANFNVRVYASTSIEVDAALVGSATQYLSFLSSNKSKAEVFSYEIANPKYVIAYYDGLTAEKISKFIVSSLDDLEVIENV